MNKLLALTVLVFSLNAYSHGGGEAAIEIGPGKGVTEVTADKAFKLAPQAMKRLDIQSIAVTSAATSVPKGTVARTLTSSQIFRIRDGWIKSIDFQTVGRAGETVSLKSKDLIPGDSIVTKGMGFLRMIVAQLGKEEEEEEEEGEHSEDTHSDKPHAEEKVAEHGHKERVQTKDEHGHKEDAHGKDEKAADHHD